MLYDLRGFTGRIVVRNDKSAEYQNARQNYNLRVSKYPAAIVFCLTVQDVINAVRTVATSNPKIPFRVRCGRHSYEELSLMDDGVIIDVSLLQSFAVTQTSAGPVARVGAGLTQGQIYKRASDLGYALPAGTAPDVGVAGVAQGGGIGMMTRYAGLTLDNILQIDLVTPQGQFVTVSADHADPAMRDLFWALRGGGGGNFGIVTGFAFKLYPIKTVTVYEMKWNYDALPAVLAYWQKWAHQVDTRLTSQMTIHPDWTGKGLNSEGLFLGPPAELEAMLDGWTGAAAPTQRSVTAMSFYDSTQFFAASDNLNYHPFKTTGGFVYADIPAAGLSVIKKRLQMAPTADCALWMQSFGGAMAARRPDETAFYHRGARFICEFVSAWQDPSDADRCMNWVRGFRQEMAPYTTGTYVNFTDLDLSNWQQMYYGTNLPRLQQIKRTVDPANLFSFEQSIPPAAISATAESAAAQMADE